MKIKPLYDRIIIAQDKEDTSKSGIFIGKPSQDNPLVGKVLYVGEGNENTDGKLLPMHIKEGDKVLYNKFAGVEAVIDNRKVYIIRQADVLAIIE